VFIRGDSVFAGVIPRGRRIGRNCSSARWDSRTKSSSASVNARTCRRSGVISSNPVSWEFARVVQQMAACTTSAVVFRAVEAASDNGRFVISGQFPGQGRISWTTLSIAQIFTPLEEAVLRGIWTKHTEDRAALEVQLAAATLLSRKNTGAGFYTDLFVERVPSAILMGQRLRNGPEAQIDGLEHGMGFILWLNDGYAGCLEGYTYTMKIRSRLLWTELSFRWTFGKSGPCNVPRGVIFATPLEPVVSRSRVRPPFSEVHWVAMVGGPALFFQRRSS